MVKQVVDFKTEDMLDTVKVFKRPNGRLGVEHMNYEKSMTQQCFSDMCDVNKIMAKWLNGNGPNPHVQPDFTQYRDVSNIGSYQDMLEVVMNAQSDFDSLSADVRARFKNDVGNLLEFVGNPANLDECVKLGLMDDESHSRVGMSPTLVESEQSSLDVTVRTDTTVV